MNKGAILVKDLQGRKAPTGPVGYVKGLIKGGGEPVNVFRGQLVVPMAEQNEDGAPPKRGDKKFYPYCLLEDPAVTVWCDEQDVAPLDSTEFQLMEGIKSREDRYEVFLSGDDHLEWGARLKRGDHVMATLPSSNPRSQVKAVAVIRYVGQLPQEPGIQFGVEIVDEEYRGQGATDGFFQGKALFHCEDNCGLFLGLDKIHPIPQAGKHAAQGRHAAQGHLQGGPQSPHSGTPVDQPLAVRKGGRAVVHNKKGITCHGTVQWLGRGAASREFKFLIAGLVMDNKASNADFEGSIPGMSHLVPCPRNHALFLPVSLVSAVQDKEGQGKGKDEVAQGKGGQGDVEQSVTTTTVAKAMNMSSQELIQQQQKIMKEVDEISEIQAVDPKVNVEAQREAYRAFEKEKEMKLQPGTQAPPLPPRGTGSAGRGGGSQCDHVAPQGQSSGGPAGGPRVRRHPSNTYEPMPGPREEDQNGSQRLPPPNRAPHGASAGVGNVHHDPGFVHGGSSQSHPLLASHSPAIRSNQPPLFPAPTTTDPYSTLPPLQQYAEGVYPAVSQSQVPVSAVGLPHAKVIVPTPPPTADPRLEEDSMVEVTTTAAPLYGVIRWIGNLPNAPYRIAGVELEEDLEGCTDGTWQGTGEQFFRCPTGRGFFCPLHSLKPDMRFEQPEPHQPRAAGMAIDNPLGHIPLEEEADQGFGSSTIPSVEKYARPERGIQGHQNSCYLDATVFGLFALSDVFDSLFLERSTDGVEESIKNTLWRRIVNPLRKNGAVRYESVMKLREQLDRLGKMKGIAQDEKDPEEFLNMLFKHTLHVQPFITIQRPQGEEEEFFVQLFMEPFEGPRLPSIEDLLRRMFKDQNIKFAQVPSKLLIQVPRYGKQFKAFEKIIPNLRLNIEDLCDSSASVKYFNTTVQSLCFICNQEGRVRCIACKGDFNSEGESVHFCEECSEKVHKKPGRSNHATERDAVVELELLSVICIETSHYVCFTHYEGHWVFMDSMADRLYNTYNIPKGVDVTGDLNEWVYSGDENRLKQTPVRKLPEYVRRFTQDIYMCVYIQPDYGMYQ